MKTLVGSILVVCLFTGSPLIFNGKVEHKSANNFEMVKNAILSLPHHHGLGNVEVLEDNGNLTTERNFLVYKSNAFFKQPKAEVKYKLIVNFTEMGYSYQFSDFKVYTYSRNRYGIFERSSSKAFAFEKLGKTKQSELKPLIANEIAKYISQLSSHSDLAGN